jgi:osmotically-inducible protein OsmY
MSGRRRLKTRAEGVRPHSDGRSRNVEAEPSTETIEREVAARAGLAVAVERDGDRLVVTGLVASEGERAAVFDVIEGVLPGVEVVDNLEVAEVLPERIEGMSLSEASAGDFAAATPFLEDNAALEPGDFSDQEILTNPRGAAGPTGTAVDEDVSEGEEVYVPPIDPPVDRDGEVRAGFQTSSMDEIDVERSADGSLGDEAIADAIRQELREDAATQDAEVEVAVRRGIVRLRGRVQSLDDAESVEEVAARVPGVVEVIDELEVPGI